MSYDLFLKPCKGTVSLQHFGAYFTARRYYTVEATKAWYHNPNTGVYFVFEWLDESSSADIDSYYPIFFNINYFRSHCFALEALAELRKLVQQFDMVVQDLQNEGMGCGQFDPEKFLSGWSCGNTFAHQCFLQHKLASPLQGEAMSLPAEQLEAIWRWNVQCDDLESVRKSAIPRIELIEFQGHLHTLCRCSEQAPSMLPETDFILVEPEQGLPRLLSWQQIAPVLQQNGQKLLHGGYSLQHSFALNALAQGLKLLPGRTADFRCLSFDRVLNKELVDEYQSDEQPITMVQLEAN